MLSLREEEDDGVNRDGSTLRRRISPRFRDAKTSSMVPVQFFVVHLDALPIFSAESVPLGGSSSCTRGSGLSLASGVGWGFGNGGGGGGRGGGGGGSVGGCSGSCISSLFLCCFVSLGGTKIWMETSAGSFCRGALVPLACAR